MLLKSESHFIPKLTMLLKYLHILSVHFLYQNNSSAVKRRNLKVLPQTFCIWMPFLLLKKKNNIFLNNIFLLDWWFRRFSFGSKKWSLALQTSMPMASKSSGMCCRMISTHGKWMGSSWLSWTLRFRLDNTNLHHVFVSTLASNLRGKLPILNKVVWKRGHNLVYIVCFDWHSFHLVFLHRYVEVYVGEKNVKPLMTWFALQDFVT